MGVEDRDELHDWKQRRSPLARKILFYVGLALIPVVIFGLMLWVAIAIVFFKWSATEESFAHTHDRKRARRPAATPAVPRDADHGELLGLHRS